MAKSFATKFAHKPGAKPDDAGLTAAEFETAVFMDAVGFSATCWKAPGEFENVEFTDLVAAMEYARATPGIKGRQWLLYAYNAKGRRTCLDKANWPEFMKLWQQHNLNLKEKK